MTATHFREWCDQKGFATDGYADAAVTLALELARPMALLEAGGTCKPGERADLTGCSPATGDAKKPGKKTPQDDPAARIAKAIEPATLANTFKALRADHPAGDFPLDKVHAVMQAQGLNPNEVRDALITGHAKGVLRLSGWAGPIDNIPHPEFAIELHSDSGKFLPLAKRLNSRGQEVYTRQDMGNQVYYYARPGPQLTEAAGTCKPGERADLTHCTPASGDVPAAPDSAAIDAHAEKLQKAGILQKFGKAGAWLKDKTKQLYAAMEKRYGRKTAIAIFVAGHVLGLGTPLAVVPGSTMIGMAPFAAIAEVYLQAKQGIARMREDVEPAPLSDDEVKRLGKQLVARLKATWEKRPVEEGEGTCKPGERADLTGCSPATKDASKKKPAKKKDDEDYGVWGKATKKAVTKPKAPASARGFLKANAEIQAGLEKRLAEIDRELADKLKVIEDEHAKRKLVPDGPMKPLSQIGKSNFDRFSKAIDSSQIDAEKKQQHRAGIEKVFSRMPDAAHQRIEKHVSTIRFHKTSSDVGRATVLDAKERDIAGRGWLRRFFDGLTGLGKVNELMWDLTAAKNAIAGRAAGTYNTVHGSLNFDGPPVMLAGVGKDDFFTLGHVQAHELGHAIDGPVKEFSKSAEWLNAYNSEIAPAAGGSPLTEYARTEPAEGFAEFTRLMYGGGFTDAEVASFPKCSKFFKDRGLWRNS